MPVEEITAVSGDIELSGTLVTPPGEGPHPTLILLHNASKPTRDFLLYRHLQELLPKHGVAVLAHDRRGNGKSGGDAVTATFADKASDAVAWIDRMREHPAVDSERIGLWGHSQGGWIGPMAAEQRDGIALMIYVSPSAVRPARQMSYAAETQIREQGFSEEQVRQGVELRRVIDEHFRGERTQEEAVAAIEAAKDEPWFAIAQVIDPRVPGAETWIPEMDFDISPLLRKMRAPQLVIFGERDRWQPADQSAEVWRDCVADDVDLTIKTIAGAGHTPTLAADPLDMREQGPIAPEYERLLLDWTLEHFKTEN